MNTDKYAPSEGDLYEQIAKRRYEYDYTSPWEHLAPAPRKLLTQAARNTMEPIIARVRRDAAREALDGFERKCDEIADRFRADAPGINVRQRERAAEFAAIYRDTHYPEETP